MNEALESFKLSVEILNHRGKYPPIDDYFKVADQILEYITTKQNPKKEIEISRQSLLNKITSSIPETIQISDFYTSATDPIFFCEQTSITHSTKGMIKLKLYEYQKDILRSYSQNQMCLLNSARQMGKTMLGARYVLWKSLFTSDHNTLVLGNKFNQTLELIEQIKFAYESLPPHLKAGVKSYRKDYIEFDNGSRIIGRAVSNYAGRGLSLNLLLIDEMAFIPHSLADDFWMSIVPTFAGSGSFIGYSTPNDSKGLFHRLWHEPSNGMVKITTPYNLHPEYSAEHIEKMKSNLGDVRFNREFLCQF